MIQKTLEGGQYNISKPENIILTNSYHNDNKISFCRCRPSQIDVVGGLT